MSIPPSRAIADRLIANDVPAAILQLDAVVQARGAGEARWDVVVTSDELTVCIRHIEGRDVTDADIGAAVATRLAHKSGRLLLVAVVPGSLSLPDRRALDLDLVGDRVFDTVWRLEEAPPESLLGALRDASGR